MTQALTMSVKEAADALGVGEDRVRELIRSGRLKSIVPGKRNVRVPRVALDEYISSNMIGGKQ